LRWLRLAAVASAASSSPGLEAPVSASGTAPSDLAKLRELIKELDSPTPAVIPNRTALPMVAPRPVKGPQIVPLKAGVPNADTGDDSVLVFEEAEQSVERALRRLAPSPGPLNNFPPTTDNSSKVYYCAPCTKFFNGAKDGPGSKMCRKKNSHSDIACYQNINGCPSDMTELTCSTTAEGAAADGTTDLDTFLVEYGFEHIAHLLRGRGVTLPQLLEFASPQGTFLYEGRSERYEAFADAVPISSETRDHLFASLEAQHAANSRCTPTRVLAYQQAKAEVQVLMTKLVQLKKVGEQLLETMVTNALNSRNMNGRRLSTTGVCPCDPWETTASALAVPGF